MTEMDSEGPPRLLAWSYADFPILLRPHARYRMNKFHLLRAAVIECEVLAAEDVLVGPEIGPELLALAHDPSYIAAVRAGTLGEGAAREMGFDWSPALYVRGCRIVGSALAAARAALLGGAGIVLGGGAHHAFADRGRGFGIFNDIVVAARVLLAEGRVRRVAVLDGDVHQGDGTAAITAEDPRIFTFSVHGEKNYPFRKECSDLDIALPDGVGDGAYLDAVDAGLAAILEEPAIDLVMFIAGADPFMDDRLGRLSVTAAGLRERDELVVETLLTRGIPVVVLMGGGYCDPIEHTVELNLQTVAVTARLWHEHHARLRQPGLQVG